MGLSFHDENSMVEAAGSLHFAPSINASDPDSETESTSIFDQERSSSDIERDDVGVQAPHESDIQM